jgi:hypothetical protein
MPAPPSVKIKETRERVSYIAGALQVNLAREIGCPVIIKANIIRRKSPGDYSRPLDPCGPLAPVRLGRVVDFLGKFSGLRGVVRCAR